MIDDTFRFAILSLALILVPTSTSAQQRRPFGLDKFLQAYALYNDRVPGGLNENEQARRQFVKSVIQRHGIAFAPTPRLRDKLTQKGVNSEIINALLNEISQGRGVGVYVFEFTCDDEAVGQGFSRLIHTEVERQKPRILEIVDRKEFLPGSANYQNWAGTPAEVYSFYVTGSVSQENQKPILTAKIRFRPAKTTIDSTIEVPPLQLTEEPSRKSAAAVANWFVDAMLDTCSPELSSDDHARVLSVISDQLGLPVTKLASDTHIRNDLGADDLDHVELVLELEDQFEITIADSEGERLFTVGDFVRCVGRHRRK